jgi:hypothetical protein
MKISKHLVGQSCCFTPICRRRGSAALPEEMEPFS